MRTIEDIRDSYEHIFSTPEGEIVLEDILNNAYVSKSTMEKAVDAPQLVMFREGARNLALYILARAGKTLGVKDGQP